MISIKKFSLVSFPRPGVRVKDSTAVTHHPRGERLQNQANRLFLSIKPLNYSQLTEFVCPLRVGAWDILAVTTETNEWLAPDRPGPMGVSD